MKVQSISFLFLFSSSILLFSSCQRTPVKSKIADTVAPVDSIDVLAAAKALQVQMPKPKTEFRPGHVSPLEIKDYLEEKSDGFAIQLPKHSLTPSPTVYKGLLLVSGGFGSKEYYAFDAQTGALKWALNLDDDGPTSAIVEDDIAVFNTESCTIFACNALTGEYLWSHYLGDPLLGTPSIADGIVFTSYPAAGIGSYGNMFQQQKVPNSLQPIYEQNESEVVAESSVDSVKYQLRGTHVLIALELQTGKILWQKWIDGDVMSAPVVEGQDLYVTTFPGTLYKFAANSGEILAAHASRATSAPVIVGKDIYMSQRSDDDRSEAREGLSVLNQDLSVAAQSYTKAAPYLDEEVQSKSALKSAALSYDAGNGFAGGAPANSGWEAASFNIGQSNVSSLQAFQGSRVLHHQGNNYATMGDELVCTHPRTGEVQWRQDLDGDLQREGGFLATPPLTVADKIIVATLGGEIIVLNAKTGKEWKRFDAGGKVRFQPVVDAGRIYVSTIGGKVVCFDTGQEELTGWPTWGANAAHTNKVR